MGNENGQLEVNPDLLRNKAKDLEGAAFGQYPPGSASAPDGTTTIADRAIKTLNSNAAVVVSYIKSADRERERIAASLRAAADAYATANGNATGAINNGTPVDGPVPVDSSRVPPTLPCDAAGACYEQPSYGHTALEVNAEQIKGKAADELQHFWDRWNTFAGSLQQHVSVFAPPEGWDGPAAEACKKAMQTHQDWLKNDLTPACTEVMNQTTQLLIAHSTAEAAHPKDEEVKRLLYDIDQAINPVRIYHLMNQYKEKQQLSDTTMTEYASKTGATTVQLAPPPSVGAIPAVERKAHSGGSGSGGGGGGGGGGTPPNAAGQPPGLGAPGDVPTPQGGQQSGGQEGGGSPSGGSPSGGSPAGGAPPGGGTPSLPDSLTDLPKLDEPATHAASAGGGSGGGAGGGGVPKMPLQPGVGSVSVGPGPASGGAPGGAVPAGAPGGGMGGMGGGGAPMGGGGHGQGAGKEKRRTPGLSPDEELYTEDRQWTEGYIGKPQRKPGTPSKDRRED